MVTRVSEEPVASVFTSALEMDVSGFSETLVIT
jgi:hypothetical protein